MTKEKLCSQCGQLKASTEFYVYTYKNRNDVLYARCKICLSVHKGEKYIKLPVGSEEYVERKRRQKRETYQRLRQKIFDAYGNVCACCGEERQEFLTVDHVNNDGAEHKRALSGSSRAGNDSVMRDIVKRDFPAEFQLLCYNCNCSKQFAGYCPHWNEGTGNGNG